MTDEGWTEADEAWSTYRKNDPNNYLTITLEGAGLPSMWVCIRKFGSFTNYEIRTHEQFWTSKRAGHFTDTDRFTIGSSQIRIPINGLEIEMIESWNLTDPRTGSSLPVPKQDLSSLECLPLGVLGYIADCIAEIAEQTFPSKKECDAYYESFYAEYLRTGKLGFENTAVSDEMMLMELGFTPREIDMNVFRKHELD